MYVYHRAPFDSFSIIVLALGNFPYQRRIFAANRSEEIVQKRTKKKESLLRPILDYFRTITSRLDT